MSCMQFVQQPYIPGETIAAVCTPPGEGGVAMIRITGDQALSVANQVFSLDVFSFSSHTVHHGNIVDSAGNHIDDVLLIVMLGSRSYAGEDTVEICCHGGSIVTREVLQVVLQAGARHARPGEFTFKAYMNGRLDLAQAEAVQQVIHAKNEHAMQAAEQQLQGGLSKKITALQKRVTEITAVIEAWVDFPEEGLEFTTPDAMTLQVKEILLQLQELIRTYHDGAIIREGIKLCLMGLPNVGKSSLMNALVDKERAIVSAKEGTTRDLVEDQVRINGLNFFVTDTAGVRDTTEEIEKEGIRRSKKAAEDADLVLFILDATEGIRESEKELLCRLQESKTLVVWNKCDLATPSCSLGQPSISLSAKNREGLQLLHQEIDRIIWRKGPPDRSEVVLTSHRHWKALQQTDQFLKRFLTGLQEGLSPEFLALECREALHHLGLVIGADIGDDILSEIFSTFCVGK